MNGSETKNKKFCLGTYEVQQMWKDETRTRMTEFTGEERMEMRVD